MSDTMRSRVLAAIGRHRSSRSPLVQMVLDDVERSLARVDPAAVAARRITLEQTREQRDAAVVKFVTSFIQAHGMSPTLAEIAAGVGLCSGTVYDRVLALVGRGVLTSEPHQHRSIRVVVQRRTGT